MKKPGGEAQLSMNQRLCLRMTAVACLLLVTSVSQAAVSHGRVVPAHFKYANRASLAEPALRSSAALVLDTTHSSVLYARHSGVALPIASITKLMTALVVMDAGQPLDEVLTVTAEDRRSGGKGGFCCAGDRRISRPGRGDAATRRAAELCARHDAHG